MSRNENRTTKRERRDARRHCPVICRIMGTATAARLRRIGVSDDATGLTRLAVALDMPPAHLEADGHYHWRRYVPGREAAAAIAGAFADVAIAGHSAAEAFTAWVPRPGVKWSKSDKPDTIDVEVVYAGPGAAPDLVEVGADSAELPEQLRTAVESTVAHLGGDAADYTVTYRAADLEGDSAEMLVMPKWERGGVLEDYAQQYRQYADAVADQITTQMLHPALADTGIDGSNYAIGWVTPEQDACARAAAEERKAAMFGTDHDQPVIAPTGAPPFNIELLGGHDPIEWLTPGPFDPGLVDRFRAGRERFNAEQVTVEHAPDTEQARAAREQLRGAGHLRVPRSMLPADDIDPDAAGELHRTIAKYCKGDPAEPPMIERTDDDDD